MRIRLIGKWAPERLEFEGGCFLADLPAAQADGLLCVYQPLPELLSFPGPRGWYPGEPIHTPRFGPNYRHWWAVLRHLPTHCQLHHCHPDPANRVPVITHWGPPSAPPEGPERQRRCVAVASNSGGLPWRRWPEIRLRNRFALHPRVDLYGSPDRWYWYRAPLWGCPPNLKGPLPGSWASDAKLSTQAGYHAAVCLENSCEEGYFTEKFVDGVRSGCVPIYHAHPSVRDGVLQGARWVDPADHGFNVEATIEHALSLDRAEVAAQNLRWLAGEAVARTEGHRVYARLGAWFARS